MVKNLSSIVFDAFSSDSHALMGTIAVNAALKISVQDVFLGRRSSFLFLMFCPGSVSSLIADELN